VTVGKIWRYHNLYLERKCVLLVYQLEGEYYTFTVSNSFFQYQEHLTTVGREKRKEREKRGERERQRSTTLSEWNANNIFLYRNGMKLKEFHCRKFGTHASATFESVHNMYICTYVHREHSAFYTCIFLQLEFLFLFLFCIRGTYSLVCLSSVFFCISQNLFEIVRS
jgi:hypothetical protein